MDFFKKIIKESIQDSEKTLPVSLLWLFKMEFKAVGLIYSLYPMQRPAGSLAFPQMGLYAETCGPWPLPT